MIQFSEPARWYAMFCIHDFNRLPQSKGVQRKVGFLSHFSAVHACLLVYRRVLLST